jgi:hypothetical protein
MNRLYYLLLAVLSLIIIFLSKGIFFGENSYNKRAEFEIKNAQNSNDHIENFAREKLNLTYKDEEFISFQKENAKDEKNE